MSSLRRLANQKASLNKGLRMRLPPNSSAFCAASKGWGLEVGGVSFWLPAKLALAGTEGTILEGSKGWSSLGRWTPSTAPSRPQAGGLGPSGPGNKAPLLRRGRVLLCGRPSSEKWAGNGEEVAAGLGAGMEGGAA